LSASCRERRHLFDALRTETIDGDLHFKAVIVDRGEEVRYLIINPGIVFAGATVKQ
jgi:hypothetical protein